MNNNINESLKNKYFKELCSKEDNFICADCPNKGPTWASIGFGVFICLNCSGKHRSLGMHITRVKSTKLDNWNNEEYSIMENIGNLMANNYYLYKNKQLKDSMNLRNKYVNKINSPSENIIEEPIKVFNKNKKNFGRDIYLNLNINSNKKNISEKIIKENEDFKVKSKKSINLLDFSTDVKTTKNENKEKNLFDLFENQNKKENDDLLDLEVNIKENSNFQNNEKNYNNVDIFFNNNFNNNDNNFNNNNNLNKKEFIQPQFNQQEPKNNFEKYNIWNTNPRNNFYQQPKINTQNNDKYSIFDHIRRF